MEEYVWISKLAHHPVFVSHAHPVLERVGRHRGIKVTVAGSDGDSLKEYLDAIRGAIARRVAGIMLVGWGDAEAVSLVDEAIDAGVPVVTVDSDVPGSRRLAHVGTNWFVMGSTMAHDVAELIGGRGKVLMIGMSGLANMEAGYRGFASEMARFPAIQVFGPEDDMDVGPKRAKEIVARYLAEHKDLHGIAGFDGNSGPGAAAALRRAKRAGKVKLVTVDAEAEQLEHIRSGTIDATYCQKREIFTYTALQMLYAYNHGSLTTGYRKGLINIPGSLDTGFIRVTAANADSFRDELGLDEAFGRHELSQQLALMTGMTENTDAVAIAADLDGQVVYMNPATADRCGIGTRDAESVEIGDIIDLDDRQLSQIKSRVRSGQSTSFETRLGCPAADAQPVQVTVSPLRSDTIIRGMVVVASDITQRKQAEEALSRSMRLQQLIADISVRLINLPLGDIDEAINDALGEVGRFVDVGRSYVFQLRDDGRILDNTHEWCAEGVEPQIERLQGLPVADYPLVARSLKAGEVLYVPDVAELPEGSAERQEFEAEGIQSLLTVAMVLGGKVMGFVGFDAVRSPTRWSDDTISLLKLIGDIVVSVLDRQRFEEALAGNETRYRHVIEHTNDGVVVYRAVDNGDDFLVVEFNRAAQQMEKMKPDDVIGRRVTDVFPGVSEFGLLEVFREVWRTGEPANHPVRLYKDNRLEGWRRNFVYKLPSGEIVAVYSDETERMLAEEQLRTSEKKFRSVVESSPLGMLMYELREGDHLVFQESNPAAEAILGDLRPVIGKDIEQAFPNLAASEIPEAYRRVAREGTRYDVEAFSYRGPDGEERFYEVHAFQTSPNHMVAAFLDVTERLRLGDQLRQAMKMEAIGQLAGGVAHDFNNQLTVIKGYGDLLIAGAGEGLTIEEGLGEIQKAVSRSERLTSQLLAFSRRQMLRPEVLNVNEIISEMSNPLSRMIGEDIELSVVLGENIGAVWADRSQVEQAVMNLAVNARDAMPHGGALAIETGIAILGKEYVRTHPEAQPGRYVMLAVSDTGVGMDEETQARVFDPFFTTKEVGKGTGLGLSMVYGFVKQSGGSVYVYSEPGEGTTFKVYMPSRDAAAEALPVAAESPVSLGGSETLLVVEDDEAVRKFMVQVLRRSGYTVLEAGRASEALPLGEHYEDDIAMIVTDVVMPGMRGPDLVARLITTRPNLGVLYVSGYTQNVVVHHGELDPEVNLLTKPFTSEQLLGAVRHVLDDAFRP